MSNIRIQRLERAVPDGWWLALTSTGADDFASGVALVRALPAYDRRWSQTQRAWWVSDAGLRALARLLPTLSARIAEEHGTRFRGRTSGPDSAGAYPPGPRGSSLPSAAVAAYRGVPADTADAFADLHLLPSAPTELVKAARRIVAKQLHPDRGGDHRKMVASNLAAERALAWAQRVEKHDAGDGRSGAA